MAAVIAASTAFAASIGSAQQPAARTASPPGFELLRADGNSFDALRSTTTVSFAGVPVGQALQAIAAKSRLNLTADNRLPGMSTKVWVSLTDVPVAQALLRIIRDQPLSIHVSATAGLVVLRDSRAVAPVAIRRPPAESLGARNGQMLDTVRAIATSFERDLFELKPNVGVVSITARELGAAPAFAQADLLRQLQLMPGVQGRNDLSSALNVRGGEADQNLVMLDGYPIYNPFHLGGLFSTFIEPMIGRVDLISGAFPARYGGRLSSVIDVKSVNEIGPGAHGTADISLISSSASVGNVLPGYRGSWTVAARRTYADKLANVLTRQSDAFPYHFQDMQARFTYALPQHIRLEATGYVGFDALQPSKARLAEIGYFKWGNTLGGVTLSRSFVDAPRALGHGLGDSVVISQRLSASRFRSRLLLEQDDTANVTSNVGELRASGDIATHGRRVSQTVGYDVATYHLSYAAEYSQEIASLFPPVDALNQHMTSVSAYYENLWRVHRSLLVQSGIRFDAVPGAKQFSLLPRLSLKYFVNKDLSVTAAAGGSSQWLHSLAQEDVPFRVFDSWIGTNPRVPLSTAWQFVLGAEKWFSPSLTLRVEAYGKRYRNLPETNYSNSPAVLGDEFVFLKGNSSGVDAYLRQRSANDAFAGWVAYTFAKSERTDASGVEFSPGQDRRHELNAVGTWRRGAKSFGMRLGLATGTPYTPILAEFEHHRYDPVRNRWSDDGNNSLAQGVGAERNSARLPLSHRIDLSVSRRGHLFGRQATPYLSVMNVYNAHNVFAYFYDFRVRPPTRISLRQFPILPSFGLKIEF